MNKEIQIKMNSICRLLKGVQEKNKQKINNEIEIHKYCARHGIAPRILGVKYRKNSVCIEMEKLNQTLYQKCKNTKCLSQTDYSNLSDLIKKMHSIGVYHMDLHAGNIMVDKNNIFKIIDFESALLYRNQHITPNFMYNKGILDNKYIHKNFQSYIHFIKMNIPIPRHNWYDLKYLKKYVI